MPTPASAPSSLPIAAADRARRKIWPRGRCPGDAPARASRRQNRSEPPRRADLTPRQQRGPPRRRPAHRCGRRRGRPAFHNSRAGSASYFASLGAPPRGHTRERNDVIRGPEPALVFAKLATRRVVDHPAVVLTSAEFCFGMNSGVTPAPAPRPRRHLPTIWVALGSKRRGAVALIDRAGTSQSTPISSPMDDSRKC